jgi:hypothetical protein
VTHRGTDRIRGIITPVRGRKILWTLAAAVFSLHLASMTAPPADWDEAALAYYSIHHQMGPWDETVPAALRSLTSIYSLPQIPVHVAQTRFFLKRFGIGLWQVRFASFGASLLSIALLLYLFRTQQLPAACSLSVFWFASTYLYFMCSHNARPDPFILLATVLTVAWYLTDGGRFSGFWLGAAAGLCLGMHAATVLLAGTMLALAFVADGIDAFRRPRYYWCFLGAACSATLLLFFVDADQAAQWSNAAMRSGNIRLPNLFFFKGNIFLMAFHSLYVLGSRLSSLNVLFTPTQALFFGVLPVQLRRWRALSKSNRVLLAVAVSLTICYGIASASLTANYLLYLNLWYAIQTFWLLSDLYQRTAVFDWLDIGLLMGSYWATGIAAFMGNTIGAFDVGWFLFSSLLFLVLYVRALRWMRMAWIWRLLPLSSFGLLFFATRCLTLTSKWINWMAGAHGAIFITASLTTLAFLICVKPLAQALEFCGGRLKVTLNGAAAFYMAGLLAGFLALDLFLIGSDVKKALPNPSFQMRLRGLSSSDRLLGPAQLYLYRPDLTFWSVIAMRNEAEMMKLPIAQQINRLHITRILWPAENVPTLRQALEQQASDQPRGRWRNDGFWETPFGNYLELTRV